jgi:iron complex transport system substrate-binding protein
MFRKVSALVIALLIALAASGCTAKADLGYSVQIPGGSVRLAGVPHRIVSLAPSNTEVLFDLGLGDKVVGVTAFCNYPAETATKEKVTNLTDYSVDLEKVVALKPDLVVGITGQEEIVSTLNGLKIPAVVMPEATNFSAVLDSIRVMGDLTKTRPAADAITDSMRKAWSTDWVIPGPNPKKVFVLLDPGLWTAGSGTFFDELIVSAGGANIAHDLSGYPQISEEQVIASNPDIILTTFPGGKDAVLARATWQGLNAVKNGAIYEVNADIYSRPGPRLIDALHDLTAKIK